MAMDEYMITEIEPGQKPAKILVVEDELSTLQILKRSLTSYGYEVVTAVNGVEALESFQRSQPDLLLLDINLPKLDGLEVCRWVRERTQLPIIILSARSEEQQKVEALELGADD